MRARTLLCITLLALCHHSLKGQVLTESLPLAGPDSNPGAVRQQNSAQTALLPDDPGQEILPIAQPEPVPPTGTPVDWKADRQTWAGDIATLFGVEDFHYRGYTLRADKVIYNRKTTEIEAEGHIQVVGGPDDVSINADHGDMRLNMHTARFYNVDGSIGVRRTGR